MIFIVKFESIKRLIGQALQVQYIKNLKPGIAILADKKRIINKLASDAITWSEANNILAQDPSVLSLQAHLGGFTFISALSDVQPVEFIRIDHEAEL